MARLEVTGSEVISTKVSVDAGERLRTAARRMGMKNRYSLMQHIIDCLLRFVDKPDECSQDMIDLIEILFGNLAHLKGKSTMSNVKENPLNYSKAIVFCHEEGRGKDTDENGQYAVMVDKPFMGEIEATYNVQDMFEKFLKVCLPAQYKALKDIAKDNDMSSLVEAFSFLVNKNRGYTEAESSIRALFQDDDRLDFGQHALDMGEGRKYKRKHNTSLYNKKLFD